MELFELQNKIAKGEVEQYYVFAGSDYALANVYADAIAKKYNLTKTYASSIEEVISDTQKIELFPEDKLYMLKYEKGAEKDIEKLNDVLGSSKAIVFTESKPKSSASYIVNFNPQKAEVFLQMVKSSVKLDKDSIIVLAEVCGYNYGRFIQEYNKVKIYAIVEGCLEDEALQKLLHLGAIHKEVSDVTFDFVSAVMERKKNLYELYKIIKAKNDSEMGLLYLLYTAVRNQFIVQTVAQASEESTGLSKGLIWVCRNRKNKFDNNKLRELMSTIQNLEQGIKMGKFEGIDTIDYLLVQAFL